MRLGPRAAVYAIWVLLYGSGQCADAQLTSAAQVKRLSMAEVGTGQPVLLRGIVTQIIPEWWGFSLQDATEGIYVSVGEPLPAGLAVGQKVEVGGRTLGGTFAPSVKSLHIQVLGNGRMPAPQPVAWQPIATGTCDNGYVEVQGVVRSLAMIDPPDWEWRATAIRLDIGGNLVSAYMRNGQSAASESLVDATVRVRGVCVVFANSSRQFQGTALSIVRPEDLEVLHPARKDPFDAPLQPIRGLFGFRSGPVSFHRVKVQGVATLQVPGGVYLQQNSDGILVRSASAPVVQPGDLVEAVGFPTLGGFSTAMEDALVRVTGHGPQPRPRDIPANRMLTRIANAPAAPNAVLVRVSGRILDRTTLAREETMILADGETTFNVRWPAGTGEVGSLETGSRVAVTGISTVQIDARRGLPVSFELLARSPQDIQILERAPWLTRGVALRAAAALLAFLIAAVIVVLLLRRRLAKQTKALRRQFEREASLEQRYSDLVENASDLVYAHDLEGRLLQANRGTEEVTGYSREELLGMNLLDLLPPDQREWAREVLRFRPEDGGSRSSAELRLLTKDGRELVIETKQRFLMENGQPVRVECIGRDVTARQRAQVEVTSERNRLEEQLHHAQRLESVGQLAGGVAHDFNNLLTVITGYAQMVLEGLSDGNPLCEPISEIAHAGDRASALTRQLLLFSRRQTTSPQIIALNDLVANLEKMLRRLIGEDILLTLALDARGEFIRADPGHIEQVVMNLVVNARDAMPGGGNLTIRTRNFHADGEYASQHLGVAEGDYVTLVVCDTGMGMTPEVRSRIFEPFFTTKDQGKGTGLGLSTVYGIVKQSGAAIFVRSNIDQGATFEILFPSVQASNTSEIDAAPAASPLSGTETVLVTEDEPGVRSFVSKVLSAQGYTVLQAANGPEALEVAGHYTGPIHLLLTDLVMPEMGGSVLAKQFAQIRPGTPVLYMSGYTDRILQPLSADDLLEKPFTPATLLLRVRTVLGD